MKPDLSRIPKVPGVYIMRDVAGAILYIGKAKALNKRVPQYFQSSRHDAKTAALVPLIRRIDYIPCATEREALLLERKLINQHQPHFNIMWKDDKSYPYVRLSMNEDFPRLSLVRKKDRLNDKAKYYGPYPKAWPVKRLLRYLWKSKLFPLRPCRWEFSEAKPLADKKIQSCLYYHTRACPAPCAGRVSKAGYREIAKRADLFFRGKFKQLQAIFEKEMKRASAAMEYEQAGQMRDNLFAIRHMEERVFMDAITEEALEKRADRRDAVVDLQQALGLKEPPFHIECFDNSHLFGKQAVGSMVCFKLGEPNKDHYRRFRIKRAPGQDDFAMMKETVMRRYARMKREGQPLPDLILIDGGKGQLGKAVEALKDVKVKVPVAALAKREEEVYIPGRERPILLDRARPGLQLLQHLRDEAHRFAVTYHRKLRDKEALS